MNNISMNQALSIWTDLMSAYYGKNGFGGDTAEIYAYRLMPYSPSYLHNEDVSRQIERNAAFSMRDIAYHFSKELDCLVEIDGLEVDMWRFNNPLFSHRCHVKVIRK